MVFAAVPLLQSCEHDDKPVGEEQLPTQAVQFINEHFPDAVISVVTFDKELFDKSYSVFFTDGNKVEFDKNGRWTDVECRFSRVPVSVIPEKIHAYVTENHPDHYVVSIDRDKYDYELDLENGVEMKFDLDFRFIGYDY